MKRLLALVLIVVLAVVASEVAASVTVHQEGPLPAPTAPTFPLIFYIELVAVLLGGLSALTFLALQRANAPGMLGVGLYTLIMGIVFFTLFPVWLSADWILDDALVLAALLAVIGLTLALASGLLLAGRSTRSALSASLLAGPGLLALVWWAAFLGAHSGPPHVGVSAAILIAVLALLALGGVALLVGPRWREIVLPVSLAGAAATFTIALLVARGRGDWATDSTSLHLYSFPIALIGKALSLAILHVTQHQHERGVPWRRRGGTTAGQSYGRQALGQ